MTRETPYKVSEDEIQALCLAHVRYRRPDDRPAEGHEWERVLLEAAGPLIAERAVADFIKRLEAEGTKRFAYRIASSTRPGIWEAAEREFKASIEAAR